MDRRLWKKLRDPEFLKFMLRQTWRIAKKNPRLYEALVEAGVPKRLPRKKDHFVTLEPKKRRKTIH
jgi:hypothetical protein